MITTRTPTAFLKLKKSAEFQSVYRRGAKKVSRSFVVFVLPNGLGYSRVGFTASRKLGIAVERNRIRRRLREIFRAAWLVLPAGVDIVVNPRSAACKARFTELKEELLSLLTGGEE